MASLNDACFVAAERLIRDIYLSLLAAKTFREQLNLLTGTRKKKKKIVRSRDKNLCLNEKKKTEQTYSAYDMKFFSASFYLNLWTVNVV